MGANPPKKVNLLLLRRIPKLSPKESSDPVLPRILRSILCSDSPDHSPSSLIKSYENKALPVVLALAIPHKLTPTNPQTNRSVRYLG